MPVDYRLHGSDIVLQPIACIEAELARQQIGIALSSPEMMEEDALLQGSEGIDILYVGRASGNGSGDPFDLFGAQLNQRQHLWRDDLAERRNPVRRYLNDGSIGIYGSGQIGQRGCGKDRLHIECDSTAPHALDQDDGEQGVSPEFEEVI